jgi:hypothetical protein
MTAQVLSLKTPTANALIDQVKAAWDRADEKKADADDWYIRTGKLLVELKGRTNRGEWLPALKKLGRSPRRAQELMELAENPKALAQQRERKSEHARQVAKRARYSAHLPEPEPEPTPDQDEGQTSEDQWQNSLANLCGDVLAIQSYWDKHFRGWRNFKCPSHIKTLAREAATELTSLTTAVTGR